MYAAGGEQTTVSNIALLDAVKEIIDEAPERAKKLEIITTQDPHRDNRKPGSPGHNELLAYKDNYGSDKFAEIAEEERRELMELNPQKGQYGKHCMVGTDGVADDAEVKSEVVVIDSCVHYLVIGESLPYDAARKATEDVYKLKRVSVLPVDEHRSNAAEPSDQYPLQPPSATLSN